MTEAPKEYQEAIGFLQTGRVTEGLDALRKLATTHPAEDIRALCLFNLAEIFEQMKRPEDAINALREAAERYPNTDGGRSADFKHKNLYFNNPTLPRPNFPPILQIEPTNACNLKCIMCPRTLMNKSVGMMEREIFEKIINEAVERGILRLKLFLMGEPLLHPQIAEFVEYASELRQRGKHFGMGIQTNGTTFPGDSLPRLLRAGIDTLAFSFSGTTAAAYEKARAGAQYSQLEQNIQAAVRLRNKLGAKTLIAISLNLFQESREEIEAFAHRWKNVVDHVSLIETVPHDNRQGLDRTGELTPSSKDSRTKNICVCIDGLTSLIVRWDGEIGFCCGDYDTRIKLGNVREKTLAEAWGSEKLITIQRAILRKDYSAIPPCVKCENRFNLSEDRGRFLSDLSKKT